MHTLLVAAVLSMLLLAGCGQPSPAASVGAATPAPSVAVLPASGSARISGDQLAAALKSSGLPIRDAVVYTAETDPNKLLGRPSQYTVKINWTDARAAQAGQATVEAFSDSDSMQVRYTYLDTVTKSSPLLVQYMSRNDAIRAILRVPSQLTPDQAAAYAQWFTTLQPA